MIEDIPMVKTDDDDDDSDAPVEITTKTSKTEKRKKPKKRRIKYTLATEEDNEANEKNFDEESALTHLIFGDDDDYLEEITSVAKTKKQIDRTKTTKPTTATATVESKKPAWVDSEEVTEEM